MRTGERFVPRSARLAHGLVLVACLRAGAAEEAEGPAAPQPLAITVGSPITAKLESTGPAFAGGDRHRAFRLIASRSGKITVRLESRQFDARVIVRDQGGIALVEDEDGGPGDSAQAVFAAEAGKEYEILAVSRGSEASGEFKIEAVEGESANLSFGQELTRDLAWYEETTRAEVSLTRKCDVLNKVGGCHLQMGATIQALEAWKGALEIARNSKDRRREGLVLGNLGVVSGHLGRPEEAISYYEKALEVHRETEDRRGEGRVLGNLAVVYSDTGRTDMAVEHYQRALEIHRETKDRRNEGAVLGNLGTAYHDRGRLEEAVEHHVKALQIHQETKNRRAEGSTLGNLGNTYSAQGQPERAVEYYQKAIEIHRETRNRRGEAIALGNLAEAHELLGRPDEAVDRYVEALEIFRETNNRRNEGIILGNLGNAYSARGQPERAIEHFERALEIHRQTNDRLGEGHVLRSLGVVYAGLGQPERAIELFERALSIQRDTKNRQGEAAALGNLGTVYREIGRTDRAVSYYEQALPIYRETKDLLGEGIVLGNLGDLAEGDAAREYFDRALSIRREAKDRRGEGIVLSSLGNAFTRAGQLEKASAYHEKAREIFRETRSRKLEAGSLWSLGRLCSNRGAGALAHDAFRSAFAIERDILEGVERGLEESALRSLTAAVLQRGVADYFQLLVKLFRNAGPGEERDALLREALDLVEGFRARTLVGSLRAGDVRALLGPEGRETWNRLRTMKEQASDLVRKAFEDLPEEKAERNEALAKLHQESQRREDEIAALERKLKAGEPKYASLFAARRAWTPEEISGLLEEGEVLLHYSVIDKQVAVFAGSARQGLDLQFLEVGAPDLEARVEAVLLDLAPRDGTLKPAPDLKKSLSELRASLFRGLDEKLAGAGALLVVPDGPLNLFPFEALVLEDGRYLVEKFRVRYAPSLHVLLELKRRERLAADVPVVLFGDPEFGKPPAEPEAPAIAMRVRGGGAFRQLEHAGDEVARIGELFAQKTVRRGAEATEARFKAEAARGRLLHAATHGRFAQAGGTGGNSLFYSGVAFAGCNRGGDGTDDGFLTSAEVMALDLRAVDLVVLSACETAAGAVHAHEGKFGLERAFFLAGVQAFLGSLWQVDDRATTEFMARFYRYLLDGKTKPEALRQAKVDFIRGAGKAFAEGAKSRERGVGLAPRPERDPSHPYCWAPFVLSGGLRR